MTCIQQLKKLTKSFAFIGLTSISVLVGTGYSQELLIQNGQTIAFLGDSITQQGGNQPGGYVNLILEALKANGIDVKSIKAGIGGHKSNDMLARVEAQVIAQKPEIMTLSCGVNDVWHGTNGVSLEDYKKNITAIADKVQAANIQLVILTATLIGAPDSENSLKLDGYNNFL